MFRLIVEYREVLLNGLIVNVTVFAWAVSLGLSLGMGACLGQLARNRILSSTATGYIELARAAPEYVALMWIYSVMPLALSSLLGFRLAFSPIVAASIALGLVSSGYFAESFRSGIQSIASGQVEAALSIGMKSAAIYRRIVLPQAIRRVLPDLLNHCIGLFKATTLVSVVTVPDILYHVDAINQQELKPMSLYSGVALMFFVLIAILTAGVNALRRREA